MKKVSLTIAIGLAGFLEMPAQPVFEHSYSESATLCQVHAGGVQSSAGKFVVR